MSRTAVHPLMRAFLEAAAAPPVGAGPLEVDYPAAIAEEARSHNDVADDRDLAPITDETLHENRDRRSERDRLMDEVGMSAKDFF